MTWSTRQLAELAGVSLRTVRYYHDVGLLEVPRREANGYKQYGVDHLVRLIRVRGLVNLGFSLPQIAALDEPGHDPVGTLRDVRAQIDRSMEQLARARDQVDKLLADPTLPPETYADLARLTDVRLSDADRKLVVVLTRVVSPEVLGSVVDVLLRGDDGPDGAGLRELDALPAEADERTRDDLARRLSAYLRRVHDEHPALREVTADTAAGSRRTAQTLRTAVDGLYNPAQVDVVRRATALLGAPPSPEG